MFAKKVTKDTFRARKKKGNKERKNKERKFKNSIR